MAQRKPPAGTPSGSSGKVSDAAAAKAAKAGKTSASGKNSASGRTSATGKTSATAKAAAAKSGSRVGTSKPAGTANTKRPPAKKKGKSIVNQRQTPWGLISAAALIVVFAAVVVGVVVATSGGSGDDSATPNSKNPYTQPELAAAKAISGVTYHAEPDHTHVSGTVKYPQSPPIGGNHAPIWAQCTGVVYDHQLANENAVHAMEHGGVWVTYNPDKLSTAQVAALAKDVDGVDRVFMTPYAGLKTPVSLQAWGYQLFVPSSTDPRIEKFIDVMSTATANYPERGASCSDPYFKADESKPGSPQETA